MTTLIPITILAGIVLAKIAREMIGPAAEPNVTVPRPLWLRMRPNFRIGSMGKLAEFTLVALLALPLLCWASGAEASCSGSGTTWNCTAGTTSAQLSSVLGSASDGATITFANGSYSWNSFVSFDNAKGATVICATVGGCNVTANGTVLGMNGNLSGNNNHLYRISGFNFSGAFNPAIWFYGCGSYGSTCLSGIGSMQQLRIDHNTFSMGSGTNWAIFLAEYNTIGGNISGVIDHNTLLSPQSSGLLNAQGATNPNFPQDRSARRITCSSRTNHHRHDDEQ